MNVKGFYTGLGATIRCEQAQKVSMTQRCENTLTLWDTLCESNQINARWKEIGAPTAANLRGTYRGFPDSVRCASLLSDLEHAIQKGQNSI